MRTAHEQRQNFCARFDRRHGLGAGEKLLALLTADAVPFQTLADAYGLSRERIRQIHAQWVKPVTGTSGRDRRLAHRLTVPHVAYPAAVRRVADAARQAGCTVSHVTERYPSGSPITRRVQLLINGVRCKIRRACPHRAFGKYDYDKAAFSPIGLAQAPVQVFVAAELFVVPAEVLRAAHFANPKRRRAVVYLPRELGREGYRGRIPWAAYVEAWPGREMRTKRRRAA
jgi:hypothetical protein